MHTSAAVCASLRAVLQGSRHWARIVAQEVAPDDKQPNNQGNAYADHRYSEQATLGQSQSSTGTLSGREQQNRRPRGDSHADDTTTGVRRLCSSAS